MFNYSVNSNSNPTALSYLEASILNQERRLRFGEPTINYSINSLELEQTPTGLPVQLTSSGSKCMHLSGCGFYQMLTYAVWQFLLTNRCQQKNDIITKIRKLIVQKEFMQTSPSTKGLIVKGIKQMHDFVQLSNLTNPIAHCMWRTDSMLAFSEFWKALLARESVKNIINAEQTENLQKSVFQILSQFLQISFSIYYQSSQMEFEKEHYQPQRSSSTQKTKATSNLLTLSLLIYSKKVNTNKEILRDSRSKLVETQSLIDDPSLLQSLEWQYVVFSQQKSQRLPNNNNINKNNNTSNNNNNPSLHNSELSRQDISQINKVDESVQQEKQQLIKLFKLKTKSELNLQRLGDDLQHNYKDEVLSPIYSSHVRNSNNNNKNIHSNNNSNCHNNNYRTDSNKQKQQQALSTTRTRKSALTNFEDDRQYYGLKKSTFIVQDNDIRIDSEQTQLHLDNIRTNMLKGEKLITDMRVFCEKIMV